MLLLSVVCLVVVNSAVSAPPDCLQSNVDSCLSVFQRDLESGVGQLEYANETTLSQICWRYKVASDCITPFMYFCSSIKKRLHRQLAEFEFACTSDRLAAASWPYMPTVGPKSGSRDEINEAYATAEQQKLVDSAIKASIAAGVTILLIFACFMADCISKCRIKMRVKKATAAASEQVPIKDAEADEKDDETEPAQTKKV